ncbi:UvrD-helicase domain-containing protein [Parasphaerochaeta coccoides]|uniref:DNA 3'-5' helicase n=1 Tax=Parasphaerochaeta coccoides (strain ATCC BAA-1237 / DSM 17374 / SPN1) TaxID=760011 RepID=F4GI40_PARC1|nr:UvrD-helicase domain-containing protein [Parasphaerochaeta coccoides]AEC02638.1 UvrD/REP helicase [Parasphaerochaeta coccoides DSM 17374]
MNTKMNTEMNANTASLTFADVLARTGRRLDDNQRRAVDCDSNCVVSAGAGSGKTTVLTYRFIRLLIEGKAHADQILTLTFTRKAAAEMHERIHALVSSLRDDPLMASELARFPQAQISTLDSFCSAIVRSDCIRYGITGDFSIDDDATTRFASVVASRLLADAQDEGARLLSVFYSPDVLVDEFLVPLATGGMDITRPLDAEADTLMVQNYFGDQLSSVLTGMEEICRQIERLDGSGVPATVRKACDIASSFLSLVNGWRASKDFAAIGDFCQDAETKWRKPGQVKAGSALAELKDITPEYVVMRDKVGLFASALSSRGNLLPIYRFLQRYQEEFFLRKRAAGILTFSDVARLAVDILLTNPAVRTFYKNRFSHIMIDEFQDNNHLQKDLLYLLAERQDLCGAAIPVARELEKGKLFFVGDEKQSIYRFRGADVSVFKQLGHEIEEAGGIALELGTNYRTEPALISLFNTLFPGVMGSGGEDYEADFRPLGSRSPSPGLLSRFTMMHQELNDLEDDPEDPWLATDEAEASAVADIIEEMLATDAYCVPDGTGGLRRPHPLEIGLLFRTGGGQISYEKAFRARHIPYSLQVSRALLLEAPVNDLYSWLQLCAYPSDGIAYAAALRSPLCGIMDASLVPILRAYNGLDSTNDSTRDPKGQSQDDDQNERQTDRQTDRQNERHERKYPMWVPFAEPATADIPCFGSVAPDVKERYLHGCSLYRKLHEKVEAGSVADALSFLWHEGGYRLFLVSHASYHVYLEHFDSLWELALQFDRSGRSLLAFLDYLRPRLGQNEKLDEMELLREEPEGVQMLTIHKSKGLEFPIVIISGMGKGGANQKTPAWFPLELEPSSALPQGRTVPVPLHMDPENSFKTGNAVYYQAKEELRSREEAELKRLLYVALTRAQYHLVLSGSDTAKTSGKDSEKKYLYSMVAENLDGNLQGDGLSYPLCDSRTIEPVRRKDFYGQSFTPSVSSIVVKAWYEDGQAVHVDTTTLRRAVTAPSENLTTASIVEVEREMEGEAEGAELPACPSDGLIRTNNLQARFGTYVHALISHALTSSAQGLQAQESQSPELQSSGSYVFPQGKKREKLFPDGMPEGVDARAFTRMLHDGEQLARNFLESTFWKNVSAQMVSCESEVPFFMRRDENGRNIVYEGIADLVVTLPDRVLVVDFKTDTFRVPRIHERQLGIYREAFSRLTRKKTEAAVCYLRSPDDVALLG